ncbi:hypothetical protein [Streptomyces sp. CNQ085]|nr:hypothetical protein [Streptomyces sp. CNQ085]
MNLKEHATRVAVLKALRDAVEEQYQATRRESSTNCARPVRSTR